MKDDGGSAFPYSVQRLQSTYHAEVKGMTLRDWFAGMALQGMIGPAIVDAARNRIEPDSVPAKMASGAYAVADAMLTERKENQ